MERGVTGLKFSAPLGQTGSDTGTERLPGSHRACRFDSSALPPAGQCPTSTPPSKLTQMEKGVVPAQPPEAADRRGDGQEDKHADRDLSALRRLLVDCRTSLGLSPDGNDEEGVQSAAELLRCILAEREELVKEVQTLKDTMRIEREEWLQFQSDLQVAVSVADRLHLEAKEELAKLRGDQEETERQLAAARERQLEADRELETAKAEHEQTHRKLASLGAELEELRDRKQTCTDRGAGRGGGVLLVTAGSERRAGAGSAAESGTGEGQVAKEPCLQGQGVAEERLQIAAAGEKRREEGKDLPRGARVTERSRSLSRLPLLSSPPSAVNGISQPLSSTSSRSLSKNQNAIRVRRAEPTSEGQESDSAGKQEEGPPPNKLCTALTDTPCTVSSTTRNQDGFSSLLRRHGGSKRNSLLRWCQSRTQGYKNIDITNFSSSWSDGLAFCAVYHTYLPSLIPYASLCPADRRENLDLAFRTGEGVGVPVSLTVEEVLRRGGPDWQRVLGYVESIYRHFEM
ncbi:hypothetical protein AGOR_G00111320 [Albula goreensis]|uniref:Cytospin-A n=1 Tax=Albula goreensis TaxID=1534307 RepID=A0A8T3DGA3_9TELE|nr:hypothetical protein AGOR_G00111320 [Albula goreensis]